MDYSVRICSPFLSKVSYRARSVIEGEKESGLIRIVFIRGGKNTFSLHGNFVELWEGEVGQVGGGDCHSLILPTLAVFWHFSSTPFW